MFVCDQLRTELWRPDFFTSDQVAPTWTRVTCRGVQIANSLEWTDWQDNPVQVILCDACGHPGCASGGYVHVSRLHRHVLWTAAQSSSDDEYDDDAYEIPFMMRSLGALALPVEVWNEWSAAVRELPHADRLTQANHAAVADAWVLGPGRSTSTVLAYLREQLLGGTTLDKESAITLVERTLTYLRRNAQTSFAQPLARLDELGVRLETLYFDGPAEIDWPAFAFAGSDTYIVLDHQHLARIETCTSAGGARLPNSTVRLEHG
ncbi:MAG TPA: hypothetical protein VGF69_17055 [Thermoanaerobaculia bacterium]|jgi:hypothetical protein